MKIPKPKKENKAKTIKQLRSFADRLWYQLCILEHGTICEVCGKSGIQVHHFFPNSIYGHLRYLVENGIVICQGCHLKHHTGSPLIQQEIINVRGIKWYNALKKKALTRPKESYATISYYKGVIEDLKTKLGCS
jgi:5-methylcytosine-specific restriction endonuclease McrA